MADDAQIIAIEHRFWYKKKSPATYLYYNNARWRCGLECKFADMKYKAFKIHLIIMEHSVHDRYYNIIGQ